MIVKKNDEVEREEVKMEGVKKTYIRWLIGTDSPAPNFYLREFELEPGGHTTFHSHENEHEVYVLEGKGQVNTENESISLERNSFALVMPKKTRGQAKIRIQKSK
jgi:quercetin dioxygenase-like cupin family protein